MKILPPKYGEVSRLHSYLSLVFRRCSHESKLMISLLSRAGLRYNEKAIAPAQTDRRSGAGPAGACLAVRTLPAALLWSSSLRSAIRSTVAGPATVTRGRTVRYRSKSRFPGRSGVLGRDSFNSRARFGVVRSDLHPLGGRALGRVDDLQAGSSTPTVPASGTATPKLSPPASADISRTTSWGPQSQEGSHRRHRDAGSHKDTSLLSVALVGNEPVSNPKRF